MGETGREEAQRVLEGEGRRTGFCLQENQGLVGGKQRAKHESPLFTDPESAGSLTC